MSPFLDHRKIGFIQPPRPSWVPRSRFKWMLITEGKGWGNNGLTAKRNNSAALGRSRSPFSRQIQNEIFELFHRYWNPHQVGDINCMLPTSTRPQTWENQKADDADFHLPHYQPIRRLPVSWPHPLWPIPVKLLTTLSRSGHTVLRTGACWRPLCLAKQ